jgi:hypothetical protein
MKRDIYFLLVTFIVIIMISCMIGGCTVTEGAAAHTSSTGPVTHASPSLPSQLQVPGNAAKSENDICAPILDKKACEQRTYSHVRATKKTPSKDLMCLWDQKEKKCHKHK